MTDQLDTLLQLREQDSERAKREFAAAESARKKIAEQIERVENRCAEIDSERASQKSEAALLNSVVRRSVDEYRRALKAEKDQFLKQLPLLQAQLDDAKDAVEKARELLQEAERNKLAVDKEIEKRTHERNRKREQAQEDALDEGTQNRWGKHD